jgi:DNA-binding XRE family transcriptional regulator
MASWLVLTLIVDEYNKACYNCPETGSILQSQDVLTMKHVQILIGKKVRELRMEAGLSQEIFADKAGIHRSFMGEIERGEVDISLSMLMKVSQALGVKISKLIQGIA